MDNVTDNYHGTTVADPYRWMESLDGQELKEWIEAENVLTRDYLDSSPDRERIKTRITELFNYPRFGVPSRQGTWYFYSFNNGLQNQSVIYKRKAGSDDSALVIDPNTLSKDGTVALGDMAYNEDGTLVAFGLSSSGSDQEEIHVRNIATGEEYPEALHWAKFTSIAWKHDNSGFFYNRYPEPGTVPRGEENNYNRLYWHKLGTPQSSDALVYERPEAKELSFPPGVTEDGKYLYLTVYRGTDEENRFYYHSVDGPERFIRLLDSADAQYSFIDNDGSVFYFQTNLKAPHGRIIAIDIDKPDPAHWKEILPEQTDVIASVAMVNNLFAVVYHHDAYSQLKLFDAGGKLIREIPMPVPGTISGLSAKRHNTELFFSFTSFLYPPTIFRYDAAKDELLAYRSAALKFDASKFETKQVFFPSRDGTKIPMFLTYKKGLAMDGGNPALLYGYGGFNVGQVPSFSASRLVWLESGGIYALVNLRGGDEYGEQWHKAGMLGKKQNVFDDFIWAAKYLDEEHYTRPSLTAIMGGSNGGLLTAACLEQAPDLYGAVVCQVPVADMLRYQKFTVGRFWTGEYGNAEDNEEQFRTLYAYSPLHNVKKGTAYPPTLLTTADHDDRVVPSHAMKLAAALQAGDAGVNPILIRIDTQAGHGGGKPISKQIEEVADTYTFLFKSLKIQAAVK